MSLIERRSSKLSAFLGVCAGREDLGGTGVSEDAGGDTVGVEDEVEDEVEDGVEDGVEKGDGDNAGDDAGLMGAVGAIGFSIMIWSKAFCSMIGHKLPKYPPRVDLSA